MVTARLLMQLHQHCQGFNSNCKKSPENQVTKVQCHKHPDCMLGIMSCQIFQVLIMIKPCSDPNMEAEPEGAGSWYLIISIIIDQWHHN